MRRALGPFLLAALSLLPGTAAGESFSLILPELVGVIDFPPFSSSRTANFDFGRKFSEIQEVSIEIEARIAAQEYDLCENHLDPQSCVHVVHQVELVPMMGTPKSNLVFAELSFTDDPSTREASGTAVAQFKHVKRKGWNFLLDGQGSLKLFWNSPSYINPPIIKNRIESSGEIFNARLIIEGTPVPDSSSVASIGGKPALKSAIVQVIGHTSTAFQGDAGEKAMSSGCRAAFDEASSMCTADEVRQSHITPGLLTKAAWIRMGSHPLWREIGNDQVSRKIQAFECGSEQHIKRQIGRVVTPDGKYRNEECDSSHPVACCTTR